MIEVNYLMDYAKTLKDSYHNWVQKNDNSSFFDVEFIHGNKYIKVLTVNQPYTHRSAHSFIVKEDIYTKDGVLKFSKGDILKAATIKAPATNFSRGSVFNPDSYKNFSWAGL